MPPTFDDRAEWFDGHYASVRGRVRLTLLLERLRETLPPAPARILDAGGGSGAVAIPLAEAGYFVTLLDLSEAMLRVALDHIASKGVEVSTVHGAIADVPDLVPGPFDAICAHAVLLYMEDPEDGLKTLRTVARPGAVLSLLEKNRGALAIRPGLKGDYEEALRTLEDPVSVGRLGIQNRARSVEGWTGLLDSTGWRVDSWVGIRLFSDLVRDDLAPERFEQLLRLERESGRRNSYGSVSRLIHLSATAT